MIMCDLEIVFPSKDERALFAKDVLLRFKLHVQKPE